MAVRIVIKKDLKNIFPKEFSNRTLIAKFMDYVVNNFFQNSSEEYINGYIGKKTVAVEEGDFYIPEASLERQAYQLTPAIVSKDPVTGQLVTAVDYTNFINTLKKQGCDTNDQNRLLSNEYWSWCPPINVDMFLNYSFYYWIEEGPVPFEMIGQTNASIDILGKTHYTYESDGETKEFINGLRVVFKNDVNTEYNDKIYIVEGVGQSIQLVQDDVQLKIDNENPDYFIMERGCKDGNSWSLRNRWFHINTIGEMSTSDGREYIQAKKPIICFNRDIELYNYGTFNRGYVDLIVDGKKSDFQGYPPKPIQGTKFKDGMVVLIKGDNQIYQISGIEAMNTVIMQPIINGLSSTGESVEGEGITVKSGKDSQGDILGGDYAGQYFYFDGYEWINGQRKTSINQSPLFNLYDDTEVVLNDPVMYPQSTFKGNRLFDYYTADDAGIENTSDLIIDEDLDKIVLTNGYGNYIFNNILDIENYSYVYNEVKQDIKGYKFYKMIKDGEPHYLNCWHISKGATSQYIVTELTVPSVKEYGNVEGTDYINCTVFDLAYYPSQSSTQNTSFVYWNGSLLIEGTDYFIMPYADKAKLYITENVDLKNNDTLYIKLLVDRLSDTIADGYFYDLPLSLTANALNGNVTQINYNECFDHMKSIIENQVGFNGESTGINNYIDTAQDLSLGTEILQHSSPIVKTMLLNSRTYSEVRNALEFINLEYSKFKKKFRTVIETMSNNNEFKEWEAMTPAEKGTDSEQSYYTSIVKTALDKINIGKEGLQPFYNNGVANYFGNVYIPATPAYLGLDKSYKPKIISLDNITINGSSPMFLLCHDGSYEDLYNDYRDNALIELETKIYESIDETWRGGLPVWNNYKMIPGKFRDTVYTYDEWRNFIASFLETWCNSNNLDYSEHTGFDYNDPFTYNYSNCVDEEGNSLHGSFRAIYLYYYDTYQPNLTPWEMLGFGNEPSWWKKRYGFAPYKSSNMAMWKDIENGYIAEGNWQGIHKEFARPGLTTKYMPVDDKGNLLNPIQIGICSEAPTSYYASMTWEAGDMGNIETVWSCTTEYRYAIQTIMYLMRPVDWVESNWNTLDRIVLFDGTPYEQTIIKDTLNRPTPNEVIIHNELIDDVYVRKIGIQQWIADFLTNENINITDYSGELIRNADTQLSYRCGRYYKEGSLKIISDNYGVLPSQNYFMYLYNSQTPKQETYSAIVISKTQKGYMIDGYDVGNPYFNVFVPYTSGKRTGVTINGRSVTYYNDWKSEVKQIKYKSVYTSVQELFNIICGYGKYLESRGWVFDKFLEDGATVLDFNSKAEEFVRWASLSPDNGMLIMLNPGFQGMTIKHNGFLDTVGQYNNGYWSITNTRGDPIYNEDLDVYRHSGYSEINSKTYVITMMKLNFIEYEHMILFDNETIYGDTIYDPKLCVRQQRLKVMGVGVKYWDGTLFAPGYIVEETGARPNYDKLVDDFKYFYDTDDIRSFGVFGEQAKKTIGYQLLPNMERMLLDDRNMFDFYKGLIREKGTKQSFGKLNRSRFIMTNENDKIDLYEIWGFNLGKFGYTSDNNVLEFKIDASKVTQNPQIISFTTSNRTETTEDSNAIIDIYWNDDEQWLKKFSTKDQNTFLFNNTNLTLPTGGFAQPNDVDYIMENEETFNYNQEHINIGETTWVIRDENDDWDILKRVDDELFVDEEIPFVSMRVKDISELLNFNTNYLDEGDLVYVTKDNLSQALDKLSEEGLYSITDSLGLLSQGQYITDSDAWIIFKYNGDETFDIYRIQNRLPVMSTMSKCFIVNDDTDETLSQIQLYDPMQGIIPSGALNEVKYITAIDPVDDYENYYKWGDEKLGYLWWDLSKVRYLDYHQGDIHYRRQYWGKQLPGSEIAIMEWTKSNEKPSDRPYVEKTSYNYKTSTMETFYYYWEKNPAEIPSVNFRKMSALGISQIINSPQDEGIVWMAPIYIGTGEYKYSSFILGNFDSVTTGSDFVIQINFKNAEELDEHHEWAIVEEGDEDDIPDSLWNKMKASLIGYDSANRIVPDPLLPERSKYGIQIRPRQSMFKNRYEAIRNFVDVVNEIFDTRDILTNTDVGKIDFDNMITSHTEYPTVEEGYSFNSYNEAVSASKITANVGHQFLVLKDENHGGIWTLWDCQQTNHLTMIDYEKYNVSKYWYYKTLYARPELEFATPIYTAQNEQLLKLNYWNKYNVNVGDIFKIQDGSDWSLLEVDSVNAINVVYDLQNQESGYVRNGKAYYINQETGEEEELGILVTEENLSKYKEIDPKPDATGNISEYNKTVSINDILNIIEDVNDNGDVVEYRNKVGYWVTKTVGTTVVANNNATINLKDSLYSFMVDEDILKAHEKGEIFIDGQTKYEYLLNETSIVINDFLSYFEMIEETELSIDENAEINEE